MPMQKKAVVDLSAIDAFARLHKLRSVESEDDGFIIPGRSGHIYEYSDTRLGVLFTSTTDGWNKRRDTAIKAGMTLLQNGDLEGTLSFDPSDSGQSKLAISISSSIRRMSIAA